MSGSFESRPAGHPTARAYAGLVEVIVTTDTSSPASTTKRQRQKNSSKLQLQRRKQKVTRMRRAIDAAFRCHNEVTATRPVFVTLTYRPGAMPRPNDIADCFKRTRQWLQRRNVPARYVWVREETSHGPHYHAVFWLPFGFNLPKPDEIGWWKHGATEVESVRNPAGIQAYLTKHATKAVATYRGRRLYGVRGIARDQRSRYQWLRSPRYVQDAFPDGGNPHRVRGGGFVNRDTGEIAISPFVCVDRGDGDGLVFERREDDRRQRDGTM